MAGLEINQLATTLHTVQAKDRMWLTEDRSRLVPEGDPAARHLFASEGTEIARADAIRYGLVSETKEEKAAREGQEKATEAAAELAAEEGVDLAAVEGTGSEGAITKADVQQAAKDDEPDKPKRGTRTKTGTRKKTGSARRTTRRKKT